MLVINVLFWLLCQSFPKIKEMKYKRSHQWIWITNRLIGQPTIVQMFGICIGFIDRSGIAGQCTRGDTSVFVQSCAFVFVRVCNCICTIWAGLGHNKREDESFNTAVPLTSPDHFWKVKILMTYIHNAIYAFVCLQMCFLFVPMSNGFYTTIIIIVFLFSIKRRKW